MKITICGSIAFYAEMTAVKDELLKMGHEVQVPELSGEAPQEFGGGKKVYFGKHIEENGGIDAFPVGHAIWDLKESAIVDHFRKLEWCDVVLVTNYAKKGIAGYVGGNTLIEIGIGFYLKRPIYILNPISSELSYKVEILGMKPMILNGDLTGIK